MNLTPQISFKNVAQTQALEEIIQKKVDGLNRYFPHIIGCRVVMEAPHKHHHKGNLYHVMVDISVPGKELTANRNTGRKATHADAYVAIRDAFEAARRQLQDYAHELRGETKRHYYRKNIDFSESYPLIP